MNGFLSSDKSSHIFKHLQRSECCRQCSADCFEILEYAPTEGDYAYKLGKAQFNSTSLSCQNDTYPLELYSFTLQLTQICYQFLSLNHN